MKSIPILTSSIKMIYIWSIILFSKVYIVVPTSNHFARVKKWIFYKFQWYVYGTNRIHKVNICLIQWNIIYEQLSKLYPWYQLTHDEIERFREHAEE